ncbi:hypothetical protein FQA39_LY02532 [Lamprigera yunnana]|nr:hypothetical protein FQA39_LY02532 [Lamprigera yunnana]
MEVIPKEINKKLDRTEERRTRIENKIDGMQAKNESIKMRNKELRDIIKRQQERIEHIEKEARRKNLVIQGIKEEEENEAIIVGKIKEIVKKMEVQLPHLVEHNLLITFKYYLLPPVRDLYTYIKTDRSESHLNIYNSCIVVNNFIKTMDSIPTSCVQLAKEQIIKYSDPKYNINDLKTGDCETMLLNQTIYYLNKSKSKWISVALYYPFEFASVVKIFGRSKQYVIFKEEEWIQFHEQRENINKYFQTFDTMWKPRQIGSKTLTFEMIEEKKILKIEDMSGNEVYLGWESVSEVWSLESVLRYRLSYSSAVERLYEELGALEFDADHEAIYGMERYYTVQQCEELRDKYKIGRKVCRKFLQGKTCSQCLVKRISEIGLRHFLDTVNKYIKDCSDSSSSSDEEVFKAVEQNGEETTEEEEE